jgi:hypothetical protein
MAITVGKLLSLLVAGAYVVAAFLSGPGKVRGVEVGRVGCAGIAALGLLFPMSVIWFPDAYGVLNFGRETSETPTWLVSVGGWVLLVGVPLALYLLRSV